MAVLRHIGFIRQRFTKLEIGRRSANIGPRRYHFPAQTQRDGQAAGQLVSIVKVQRKALALKITFGDCHREISAERGADQEVRRGSTTHSVSRVGGKAAIELKLAACVLVPCLIVFIKPVFPAEPQRMFTVNPVEIISPLNDFVVDDERPVGAVTEAAQPVCRQRHRGYPPAQGIFCFEGQIQFVNHISGPAQLLRHRIEKLRVSETEFIYLTRRQYPGIGKHVLFRIGDERASAER